MGPRTDVCGIKRQSFISFLLFILHCFFVSFKIYLFYIWVVYLHICILGAYRVQMWALDPLELEFWMAVTHHMSLLQEQVLLPAEPSLQPQLSTF